MTRLASPTVIACPTCGTPALLRNYRSINLYGTSEWSDGYRSGVPFGNPPVTRCRCENIYWIEEAPVLGRMPEEIQEHRGISGWMQRLFGGKAIRSAEEPPPLSWQWAKDVDPLDLRNMLALLDHSQPIERETWLRQKVWQWLNHPLRGKREQYPHEAALHRDCWQDNLERLLARLGEDGHGNLLLRGEILREMGRFDEAVALFKDVGGDRQNQADLLRAEAERCNAQVVMLVDHGW